LHRQKLCHKPRNTRKEPPKKWKRRETDSPSIQREHGFAAMDLVIIHYEHILASRIVRLQQHLQETSTEKQRHRYHMAGWR
jgi:hypothetical protein